MTGLIIPSKLKSALILVTSLLSIYATIGFSILPAVLSHKFPAIATEQLNRKVTVSDIQFNPFSLEFSIHGLQIDDLDNSAFVKFNRLYINLAVIDTLLNLSLKIDQLLLESPYVSVIRNKNADFNFTDLIPADDADQSKDKEENKIFPVTIGFFSISGGKLSWADKLNSEDHQEDIYPINLNIDNFTTLINKQSDLGFSLKFASGGYFNWRGDLTLNPLKSTGHIELNQIDLPRVWELLLENSVNFSILKGSELIKADYQFNSIQDSTQLIIDNAEIALIDIQIAEKGIKDTLINIPDFKVSGISLDLLNQDIKIDRVSSKDAYFKAWLNSDNSINFQKLFASKEPVPQTITPSTETTKTTKPWNVFLNQLDINNYALNFTDKTLSPANTIKLTSINFNSSKLSSKKGSPLPFDLTLKFNQSGNIAVKGLTTLEPMSSEMKLNIANIALKDFQAYVNQFARLDIISGLFNLDAKISLQQQKQQPLAITFKGNSYIDKLTSRDQVSNKDFVNWKKLSLNNIDLDIAANQYIIDSVKIDQPYARVLIRKDKTINISDIVIERSQDKKKRPLKSSRQKTNKLTHILKSISL